MFTVTPKKIGPLLLSCATVGLTAIILSSPGVGKSSLVHQFADIHGLKIIDQRLSTMTPEDLQGYPMRNGNKATFTPFDIFPLEEDEIPKGYNGWLLFLDEMTSASKPVQAAAYKLILDRMVGSFRLHPNVVIVAAGNKMTDRAVVTQMSTALQSRMIHFELEESPKEWMEYGYKNSIDSRILAFIGYKPKLLMDFRPDHQDKTFPCPRTWEFLSKLIKDHDVDEESGPLIAGTIGAGVATEFISFVKEFDNVPKLSEILADPKGTRIPPEPSTKYATISMLGEYITNENLDNILEYIERFPMEMQILFSIGTSTRKPELRSKHKGFRDYLLKMARYLQ